MGGNPLTRGQPFPWHTANQPPCPDSGKGPADLPRPTFRDDRSHVASHGQVPFCIPTGVGLHGQHWKIGIGLWLLQICVCVCSPHISDPWVPSTLLWLLTFSMPVLFCCLCSAVLQGRG
ncbi:hypothetical protein J1605_016134 [Eschrichtius robustus]|uniref:Uncharacterized protein n=1 Tax=Eschrichtius robustus TaxID=9764 RepID=A0AB34G7Q0_ESCRO|nr:hypothetical protein J1605_016134 [Eschrichtius robustus]